MGAVSSNRGTIAVMVMVIALLFGSLPSAAFGTSVGPSSTSEVSDHPVQSAGSFSGGHKVNPPDDSSSATDSNGNGIRIVTRARQLDPVTEAERGGTTYDRYLISVSVTVQPNSANGWYPNSDGLDDSAGPTLDLSLQTDTGQFIIDPDHIAPHDDQERVISETDTISAGVSYPPGGSLSASHSETVQVPSTEIDFRGADPTHLEWQSGINTGDEEGGDHIYEYVAALKVPEGTSVGEITTSATARYYKPDCGLFCGALTSQVSDSLTYRFSGVGPQPEITNVKVTDPGSSVSTNDVDVGDQVRIQITGINRGGTAQWGALQLSFPTNPEFVESRASFDNSEIFTRTAGEQLWVGYGDHQETAQYLHVEGSHGQWVAGEEHTLNVYVRPASGEQQWHSTNIPVEEKFVMKWGSEVTSDWQSRDNDQFIADPAQHSSYPLDQQQEHVRRDTVIDVQDPPRTIEIAPTDVAIQTGERRTFEAEVTYESGVSEDISSQATWSSRNTDVAERTSGTQFEAVSPGTTEILARFSAAGDSETGSTGFDVIDQSPVARAGGAYSSVVGEWVTLDGTASADRDENGDSVSNYQWTFEGSPQVRERDSATPRVKYTDSGTFDVSLVVTDNEGTQSSESSTSVEITNKQPEATISLPSELTAGSQATLVGSGSDTDEGGNEITDVEWQFEGSPSVQNAGSTEPTVTYDSAGTYSVEFRVKDDESSWSQWATGTLDVAATSTTLTPTTDTPTTTTIHGTTTEDGTTSDGETTTDDQETTESTTHTVPPPEDTTTDEATAGGDGQSTATTGSSDSSDSSEVEVNAEVPTSVPGFGFGAIVVSLLIGALRFGRL